MLALSHLHFETLSSTNDEAKLRAASGCAHGTLITADYQTKGRGRFEREWFSSAKENFLGSFVLYPKRQPSEWGGTALLAALAIQSAIWEIASLDSNLKWTNDVFIGQKKIAGVLIETHINENDNWIVVGIGCNVNQEKFPPTMKFEPTSLAIETGKKYSLSDFTKILSVNFSNWYDLWDREGSRSIVDSWKSKSNLLGKKIVVALNDGIVSGIFSDLLPDGCLRVIDSQGKSFDIHSGEIISFEL